ncbi:MAG: serine protease [Thermodesulfovibrionales bacterium]|nr:serine protease [Thermodesulfovibrionales bacterium]
MGNINEIFAVVTLIIQIQNGKPIGSATGFFYIKNDIVYLITNRHVVGDDKKIKPETLRIRLHSDPNDLTKNDNFDIPLYSDGVPKWHVHKNYLKNKIDVAVIEIDQNKIKEGHFIKGISSGNFFPKNFVIQPGEDVMIIGFPRGLSDIKHNLPIVRNAMISSVYGVDFQDNQFFLVDANLHPGMSGSPVITKPKNIWPDEKGDATLLTGSPMYFLGVHSATLGISLPSGEEPLGLGTVWYGYLIEEIIDSIGN